MKYRLRTVTKVEHLDSTSYYRHRLTLECGHIAVPRWNGKTKYVAGETISRCYKCCDDIIFESTGDILTARQAAKILGLSVSSIGHYCKLGRLKYSRYKGEYRINRQDLMQFQAKKRKKGRVKSILPDDFDVSILPDGRDKEIIKLRLQGESLVNVGKVFGLSGERIRKIEKRLLEKQ